MVNEYKEEVEQLEGQEENGEEVEEKKFLARYHQRLADKYNLDEGS